jgi:hypothetical protein
VLKESGVVLKNYLPAKHKVSILSDTGERFDAVAIAPKVISSLRPGYRITYSLLHGGYFAKLSNVEIILIPRAVCFSNLQYLHQIFTLCVLAIPEGQISLEAANLLKLLSNISTNNWNQARQRLFICHLLSLLGFYPELSNQQYDLMKKMHQINNIKVSDFMNIDIDVDTENFLTKWISEFVSEHVSPNTAALFSTVY